MKVLSIRPTAPRAAGARRAAPAPARRSRQRVAARATLEQENASMRDAEERWQSQLREGVVKNVMAKDVAAFAADGWTILDVRPPSETRKVHVRDAVEVPLFVADTSLSPSSLLKQMSAFGMGGWWLGGTHMVANDKFLADVQAKVPKDAKVLVGCQKGLRSLAACEALSRAGYGELAWVNGGFDNSRPGDVPTRDGTDIRMGGVGGLSSVLGWTEVQQETAGPMGSAKSVLALVAGVVAIDLLFFAYEQYVYVQSQGAGIQ